MVVAACRTIHNYRDRRVQLVRFMWSILPAGETMVGLYVERRQVF
jgi:hypothetical protein